MIESIYNAGYGIWNYLINIAMTLFTTSPTAANGSVYGTTKTLYNAISSIATPIAVVFFLIAILKDVMGTPVEQQARRFLQDALKFTVMIGIVLNLWDIMGYIMQIADGITDSFASNTHATYELSVSDDLKAVLAELDADVDFFSAEKWEQIKATIIMMIASMATFGIVIASGISIISCAFQRIIKPLVILPFSSIAVAMGTGSGDASRVMVNYLKTFFGFCLSGAFMVICIKLGVSLSDGGLIAFDLDSLSTTEKALYISVQNAIVPLVISGLVKGTDSIISKIF